MNLELMAMRWLWIEARCHYLLEQRTPSYTGGVPDVIGITRGRFLIEVEIKRTVSDFRADMAKRHRQNFQERAPYRPRQLYYLMPDEVYEKVKLEIPQWAGAMTNDKSLASLTVRKVAPVNKESKRLTIEDCVRAARQMVAHSMSLRNRLETCKNRFLYGDNLTHVDWYPAEVGTYEI